MAKLFSKKEIFKVKSVPVDPTSIAEPTTVDDYQRRGMAYYARKQYSEAESDLKKAITFDPKSIDSFYSLGMVYKAMGRDDDAVNAFKQVVNLIKERSDASAVKYDMLRKLALGHINEITKGDWNLETEIWKRV
jgi:tetratricopeptide (TPR) repeat protein